MEVISENKRINMLPGEIRRFFFLIRKQFIIAGSFLFYNTAVFAQQTTFSEDPSLTHYCHCEAKWSNPDSANLFSAPFRVLETGYAIAFVYKTMIKGSCWDFVNEVFRKAGIEEKEKKTVYRASKSGPYASSDMVQPGDWIYHINHQYNDIEHSAIFVCWKDFAKKIAITLSYAGRNRTAGAKYAEYDLKSIYSIFRPTSID